MATTPRKTPEFRKATEFCLQVIANCDWLERTVTTKGSRHKRVDSIWIVSDGKFIGKVAEKVVESLRKQR